MRLEEAIMECVGNKELMREYKRLTGARLGGGPPIHRMIDTATGFADAEWYKFFDFVRDYIYMPVLLKTTP